MIARLLVLFLPSIASLAWSDSPAILVAWSLAGSVSIAVLAQTSWFRQPRDGERAAERLLRPGFIFHFYFVAFHVLGGTAYVLNAAGYRFWTQTWHGSAYDLVMASRAQWLMLLGHAGTTAGMKLVGLSYGPPKYRVRNLPPYALLVVSAVAYAGATSMAGVPELYNVRHKLLDVSAVAVLLELALSLRRRHSTSMAATAVLLLLNVLQDAVSGWKGVVLTTAITLGAMLYPMTRRVVVAGGVAFVVFWALFLYPLGGAIRNLAWYSGVEHDAAVAISFEQALNLSFDERLEGVWQMLVGRANDLEQFKRYLEHVPGARPFYDTEIAREALIGLIPRFIWPTKPDLEKLAMQRVYEAGVTARSASVSAKANLYQEGYLSKGWVGILLASVLCGMIVMAISRLCERWFGGYTLGTCLIYTGLFAVSFNLPQAFLFFVNGAWASMLAVIGVFVLGRSFGFIEPVPVLRPARRGAAALRPGLRVSAGRPR